MTNQKDKIKRNEPNFLLSNVIDNDVFSREDFSEEQNAIGQMVRNFAVERILPISENLNHYDKELSLQLLKEMGGLGLTGIDIPKQFGGNPMDKVSTAIIEEELAYCGSPSFGVTFGCQVNIGSLAIIWFGTDKQKKKYLPKIATGEWLGAFGLTEPTAGSDAMSVKSNAELTKDGKYYKLNGQKNFITNGGWADVYTIFCQVDSDKFSCFILEKGMPGFEIGKEENKMGMKGSSTVQLFFNDVMVPKENLIHKVGRGAEVAFNVLGITRLKFGSSLAGACKSTIDHTIKYAIERKQFGESIANFGAIKSKLADMVIDTFSLDSMSYRTLGMVANEVKTLDKNDNNYFKSVGLLLQNYMMEMSMTKVLSSEILGKVVDKGLQVYGGYGFIEEYPMAGVYRDIRVHRIWDGSNEINRQITSKTILASILKGKLKINSKCNTKKFNGQFLIREFQSVEAGKKMIGLLLNSAVEELGEAVMENQQLQENFADILTDVYSLESALGRINRIKKDKDIFQKMAKALTIKTANNVLSKSKLCLLHVFKGKLPTKIKINFNELSEFIESDDDLFELRESIANHLIEKGTYPF